jgi:hypothetical protein
MNVPDTVMPDETSTTSENEIDLSFDDDDCVELCARL